MECVLKEKIDRYSSAQINNSDSNHSLYFKVSDISKIFNLSPQKVRRLIKKHRVPHLKINRDLRITLEDFVYQIIEPNEKPPNPFYLLSVLNYGSLHFERIKDSKSDYFNMENISNNLLDYSFQFAEKWDYLHRHGLD
ncbi:helix-turn-helix domain-containing protein [Nanoarchaeota archaeon]